MTCYYQIDGKPDLARDSSSFGVLNINKNALEQAKKEKQKRLEQASQVQELKQEVSELKQMMQLILNKLEK